MTKEIIKQLLKAYTQSDKDKMRFFALIYKSTGLTRKAFLIGFLADFVNASDWER